jgi:twitching motility protein PilT
LREDPDVILVGEMRDLETVALAITLAETGALVFATLHTNSAAKTIDRIIDVFPPGRQEQVRTMLATSLKAIVAQQLLRQADGQGRVAAREILIGSPALSNIIRENRTERIPSYIQSGRDQGMITMDTTLRAYVEGGLVTGEEAYMFAHEKTLFQEFFHHDVSTKPARPAKEGSGVGPKPQAQGGAGPKPQAPTRPQGPAPKN